MKFNSPSRFTSFYESFSDLIFATMAIFVLLMMVFLTLIQPAGNENLEEELKEALDKVSEQAEQIDKAESQRDKAREQAQSLVNQLTNLEEAIKADGLELVIAVDVSGSMGDALGHLVETITTISKVLPKITPNYHLGIVAYRDGANDTAPLNIFNLQKVQADTKDRGASFNRLDNYLSNLIASPGAAPIGKAVDKSIDMLSSSESNEGYQVFLLLGDVGPYEYLKEPNFNSKKKLNENAIFTKVSLWVKGGEKRRIISLFSGKKPHPSDSNATFWYSENIHFFEEIAIRAEQPNNFTSNVGNMLAYILTAIVQGN